MQTVRPAPLKTDRYDMTTCIKYVMAALLAAACIVSNAQEKEDGRIIDAVQKYSDWDFNGAVKILDSIISDNPENDAAWYYKGLCDIFRKDYESACKNLLKAVEIDSTNYWYRFNLAGAYKMLGENDMSIAQYERLAEDWPKKADLYYNLGDLFISDKRYDEALRTIKEIEAIQGKHDGTVITSYRILLQQGKQEEALKVLKEYNDEYSSPQVLTMLGDHEMGMFNDTTALAYYDEALSLDSGYAPARIGKAEAFRMTRRYPEYFSEIGGVMADESLGGESKANYLMQLVQGSDPRFLSTWKDSVDTAFETLLEHHHRDSSVNWASAQYYLYTDRKERAKELVEKNMDDYPEDPYSAGKCIGVMQLLGDYEGLIRVAEKAEERFPGSFLEEIAVGEYFSGNYERVIQLYEKVLETAPDDRQRCLTAYSNIGDMHHMLGDAQKAFKAYDKALKIDPGYLPVLNNYAYYLSVEAENAAGPGAKKKLGKALKMSKKTIDAEPDNATYLDTFGWILHLQGKDSAAKPFFKHAMLYGGKESKTILTHYAEVLQALGENDLAKVYFDLAKNKKD